MLEARLEVGGVGGNSTIELLSSLECFRVSSLFFINQRLICYVYNDSDDSL